MPKFPKFSSFALSLAVGLAVLLCPGAVKANNLVISNVSLGDRDAAANTAVVQFDVSWNNSWRNDTNHDAVWVFLKVSKNTSAAWVHGKLKTNGTNPVGTDPGSNRDIDILVYADKVGAMIQRKPGNTGAGSVTSSKVQVTLDYAAAPLGAADTDKIRVQVLGVEMVYVPEGAFYLGDGDGTSESLYAFHSGSSNAAAQVTNSLVGDFHVDAGGSDDAALTTAAGIGIKGDKGLDGDDDGDFYDPLDNPFFPTGYLPFYVMKYEVTQEQYRDFLNMIPSTDFSRRRANAINYVMSPGGSDVVDRQGLFFPNIGSGAQVGCDLDNDGVLNENGDGCTLAMNYLSWMDLAAYADWSGLRPLTELEFEKASRGPGNASYGEYIWGSAVITPATGFSDSGTPSETADNVGDNGLANYDTGSGPYRVGFGSSATTSRSQAAAGYYGGMDLGGNVWEHVVSVGNASGRTFQGTHGDGILNSETSYEGNATNTDWPGATVAFAARGVNTADGAGLRGGAFNSAATTLAVSDRSQGANNDFSRTAYQGGRLAHSAWDSITQVSTTYSGTDGTGVATWSGAASNILASDDVYLTATTASAAGSSNYLTTKTYNFTAVPSSAKIKGVVGKLERKCSVAPPTGCTDQAFRLFVDGAMDTATPGTLSIPIATTDAGVYFGGPTDTWGMNLTPQQVLNSGNFGFGYQAYLNGAGDTVSVDQAAMTVYFDIAP